MKLRFYQDRINAAVNEFMDSNEERGQVYSPTGSGKTVCFIASISEAIAKGAKNIAVIHPRIALSQDQLKRFQSAFGTKVHFTSFHSGGHVAGRSKTREESTTSPKDLKKIIEQTERPHVTFSSYHSFGKLTSVVEDSDTDDKEEFQFDVVICDEAHNFFEDRFYSWLPLIPAKKILFYTATPIELFIEESAEKGEDKYMKNKSLFGRLLVAVAPTELIKPGYIVAPLIHRLNVVSDATHEMADPISMIARAYVAQWKETNAHRMPYHQMLVASTGLPQMQDLQENLVKFWDALKAESGGALEQVDVYCISSAGEFKNGRVLDNRFEALEAIRDSGKNAVVVHYDTLAEGIDIDSLTGAFIMRKLSKAKFMQTIGRCGRPFSLDLDSNKDPKKEIYNPEEKIDLRMKRRCIITIPVVDGVFFGNYSGIEWCEAFISAGYEDLWSYIHESESTPTGKPGGKKGDEDNEYSAIQSHMIDRLVVDLEEFFEGGL